MKTQEYHFAFGIHSNIPLCCVEFFIGEYNEMWKDGKQFYQKALIKKRWNYIPCLKCAKSRNKIVLHECDARCVPFLRSIGVSEKCIREKISITLRLSKSYRIRKKKGFEKWNKEKPNYSLQDLVS